MIELYILSTGLKSHGEVLRTVEWDVSKPIPAVIAWNSRTYIFTQNNSYVETTPYELAD